MITAIGPGIGKPKEDGNGKDEAASISLGYVTAAHYHDRADVDGSHIARCC